MENLGEKNFTLKSAAGCKEPDEAYIDLQRKIIFIIEKSSNKHLVLLMKKYKLPISKKNTMENCFLISKSITYIAFQIGLNTMTIKVY